MNAISSAAPCHVVTQGGDTYDVVCWVWDSVGHRPTAWVLFDGFPRQWFDVPGGPVLISGQAQ